MVRAEEHHPIERASALEATSGRVSLNLPPGLAGVGIHCVSQSLLPDFADTPCGRSGVTFVWRQTDRTCRTKSENHAVVVDEEQHPVERPLALEEAVCLVVEVRSVAQSLIHRLAEDPRERSRTSSGCTKIAFVR